jgi:hypothetical protein
MGFIIEYLSDGTVKATLDLKGEDVCTPKALPEPPSEGKEPRAAQAKPTAEIPIVEAKSREPTSA